MCSPTPALRRRSSRLAAASFSNDNPATSAAEAPITRERPLPEDLDKVINQPGLARACVVVDKEFPDGYTGVVEKKRDPARRSVLQQHVDFFDADGDGVIWLQDTIAGFKSVGFSGSVTVVGPFVIHLFLSYPTLPPGRWLPDLRLPIYTDRIHKTKHGSDSQVFDNEGRFQPNKFEEIFTKFDKGNKGGLTKQELDGMVRANKQLLDNVGSFLSGLEWGALFNLVAVDGLMRKQDIRGCYDGTLFYLRAQELAQKAAA